MQAALELGDTTFEALAGCLAGLLQQETECGARHFGHAAEALGEAELAAAVIFVRCEAETDHSTFRIRRHVDALGVGNAIAVELDRDGALAPAIGAAVKGPAPH